MAVVPQGLDLAGVLNHLAGVDQPGPLWGASQAANMAWASVNGHGAKAATVDAFGRGLYSLLAALNLKNGSTGLGLNLVCNQLAGTVGYEADLALRIYAGLP